MIIAKANGYWSGSGGFDFSKADSLLTDVFRKYSLGKKGDNDRYDIYASLKDEIDSGRVCIFKMKAQETCGCGYVTFSV